MYWYSSDSCLQHALFFFPVRLVSYPTVVCEYSQVVLVDRLRWDEAPCNHDGGPIAHRFADDGHEEQRLGLFCLLASHCWACNSEPPPPHLVAQ